MQKSIKWSLTGLLLAATGLRAGELDGLVSNQSSKGPITITLCQECAKDEDVLIKLAGPPLGRGKLAAPPALLKGADLSRKIEPGQTAVIALKEPPSPAGAPVLRTFRVTQEGQSGECSFTYKVSWKGGKPAAEIVPEGGNSPRADVEQADANLVLFWGYLLTGI